MPVPLRPPGAPRSDAPARPREATRGAKGEQTALRILDAAEGVFSERGFEAASLREIARRAGIQQPGLYNYFASKEALYAAVLDRALEPMAGALEAVPRSPTRPGSPADRAARMAGVMTDLLLEHPRVAGLFHRALQGDPDTVGNRLVKSWLDRLFARALDALEADRESPADRTERVLQTIAMFHATTGFFVSQQIFVTLAGGEITDPAIVARQKRLLERLARAAVDPD